MKWLLSRLSEPSTMAGVSGLFAALSGMIYGGVPLSVGIPGAVGAALAVVVKERSNG